MGIGRSYIKDIGMRYIAILILMLAGCSTPLQQMNNFMESNGHAPAEVVYGWDLSNRLAYTVLSNPAVIHVNTYRFPYQYEAQILKHEAGHCMSLRHCENKGCLMYRNIEVWPIHLVDKKLCKECKLCL